jgi:hypothetical protein
MPNNASKLVALIVYNSPRVKALEAKEKVYEQCPNQIQRAS